MTGFTKKGKYEFRKTEKGGLIVINPNGRRQYLPPPEHLRGRYLANADNLNKGIETQISYWGVPACGKRNFAEGLAAIGISPTRKTKRGQVIIGRVQPEEIVSAIKDFWPQSEVKKFLAGEEVVLPRIVDFSIKYQREYHSAHRTKGGFEPVLEQVYPGLYEKLYGRNPRGANRIRAGKIDSETIRKELIRRFYHGKPISKSGLLHSEDPRDRKLFGEVMALSRNKHLFGSRTKGYTKTVEKLTGLKRNDIGIPTRYSNYFGRFGEKLTHFLIEWARLTDVDLSEYFSDGPIYTNGGKTKFLFDGSDCIADLRIGNQPVEVKTGLTDFCEGHPEEFIRRYKPGENCWLTGEPLESSVVICHQPPKLYEKHRPSFEQAGICVVGYEVFHGLLAEVVARMKTEYAQQLKELQPRMFSAFYLVRLHEELSLAPTFLARPGNRQRRDWSYSVLESLIDKAQELKK